MTLILETGAGTPNANSYVTAAFVTSYLTERARETENSWDSAGTERQEEAAIAASAYIDQRWGPRFKGIRLQLNLQARAASGTLTFGAIPLANETLTLGQKVYRFVSSLSQENDVLIGSTILESLTNLKAAINNEGGSNYHEDTIQNYEAFALDPETSTMALSAQSNGENGNVITLATDITSASVTSSTLTGGLDGGVQPMEFPRKNLRDRNGVLVTGIPLKLKQATAEYAVRSLSAELFRDPTVGSLAGDVKRVREKVGPIEEETEFVDGTYLRERLIPYPAADRLLQDYVLSGGRVIRG